MIESVFISITILIIICAFISLVYDISVNNIGITTMLLLIALGVFTIVGSKHVVFNIEINKQYKVINKDPFRPIEVYTVIDKQGDFILYSVDYGDYIMTNSMSQRSFDRETNPITDDR